MAVPENVLLLAYYFPPLGMAGVGRPLALFRHLPEFGYKIHIVTVKNILYPEYDYSLLRRDDSPSIHRTGSLDPSRILYLLGKRHQRRAEFPRLTGKLPLYFPDLKRGWIPFAVRQAEEIIERENIKTIITTSPPPSIHIAGLKLKRKLGINWVADFRDYWFPLPIEKIYPPGIMRRYSMNLKKSILESADEIVSVNREIRDYLGRGEIITNGASPETIAAWTGPVADRSRRFTIGLLGSFHQVVPIEPLFNAVRELVEGGLIPPDEIVIEHVGHGRAILKAKAGEYNLGGIFDSQGYLPRAEAIRELRTADVLYLAVRAPEGYNILPGRIFDYLVSGKPIIGVVPENSSAAELLGSYPGGYPIYEESVPLLKEKLRSEYELYRKSEFIADSKNIDVEKYSTRSLARKYAALLKRL